MQIWVDIDKIQLSAYLIRRIIVKKFWIYMAVPMTMLNGCQKQPVYVETAGSNMIEERTDQIEESIPVEDETEDSLETSTGTLARVPTEADFSGSTVSIARSNKARAVDITEREIEEMVRSVAGDLNTVIKNGQTVVLKPNLVQMIVDSTGELLDEEVNGITTDWRVTKAVVKMVRELNPDGVVYVMEGSATGPTKEVMEYFHYTPEFIEGVDGFISLEEDCGAWQDFNAPEVVKVDLPDGLLHQTYYFNKILYEADVIISIPALKTSSGVVVTGSIKNVSIGTPPGNLYGAGPNRPSKMKMVSHKITDGELDKWIYDYYRAKPVNYVIVDGLQGFQSGPVPMSHEKKETDKMNMGIMMGGKDPVAIDNICALITGWDPQSVGYLNLFRDNMELGEMENIRVKGAFVDDLRKRFTLNIPELGGIPVQVSSGPALTAEVDIDGEKLNICYKTGENACKTEVYVDGIFQYSGEVNTKAASTDVSDTDLAISLNIPTLSGGRHWVQIFVYDRFLNKTVENVILD